MCVYAFMHLGNAINSCCDGVRTVMEHVQLMASEGGKLRYTDAVYPVYLTR